MKTLVPRWTGKHNRLTLFFEALPGKVLQARQTVKATAAVLGLSWGAALTIMD